MKAREAGGDGNELPAHRGAPCRAASSQTLAAQQGFVGQRERQGRKPPPPRGMIYFATQLQPVLLHHSRCFIASGRGCRHPPCSTQPSARRCVGSERCRARPDPWAWTTAVCERQGLDLHGAGGTAEANLGLRMGNDARISGAGRDAPPPCLTAPPQLGGIHISTASRERLRAFPVSVRLQEPGGTEPACGHRELLRIAN